MGFDNVRTCKSCRRMFQSPFGKVLCPQCAEKEEDDLQKVKDYLWEHRTAPMNVVSEECEVSPQQIKQWLREERIQLTPESVIEFKCESCGCNIISGRYCEKCRSSQAKTFNEILASRKKEELKKIVQAHKEEKMRFISR